MSKVCEGKTHLKKRQTDLADRFKLVVEQRGDEGLMGVDVVERREEDDGLADDLAAKGWVDGKVDRKLRQVLGRDLEVKRLALVDEREDDAVRHRRDVGLRRHDEFDRRPVVLVDALLGRAVQLDGRDGGSTGRDLARERPAERELDEASLVKAARREGSQISAPIRER
jgi:hypothetical protein